MTDFDPTKMMNKIRGLLAKAESVAGTPEADTLTEKAFALMSKYGIDMAMASESGQSNGNGDAMKAATFTWPDSDRFGYEKMILVHRICRALHCDAIQIAGQTMQVFGLARHMERVKFLFDLLLPQMLSGATTVRPANPFDGARDMRGATAKVNGLRAEWMVGFADTVMDRLRAQESAAANAYGNSAALAMISDEDRARAAMHKKYPNIGTGRARRAGGAGYAAGRAAGNAADVGNSRLGGTRTALNA